MTTRRWPDVVLAGFGSGASQLTIEAQQVAVRVGRALALDLPPRLKELLERQGVSVTELSGLFEDRPFAEAYAAVGETVLAHGRQAPPAVFLSQGSPLFLNAITRYIAAEAAKRGLSVRSYPGVSPVDAIVADLGIDVGQGGLQIISARGLVARPERVHTHAPLLVLQAGGVASPESSAEAFGPLARVLSMQYPPEHALTLLNMPGDGGVTRATVTVARFAELIPHIDNSSSLYLERAERAQPRAAQ
jgi:hypothetical protein